MSKFFKIMLLVAVLSVFAINMSADDSKTKGSSVLSSLLESLNGSGSLGEVGNIVQNLISTDNIEIKDIAGTWEYSAPAVSFKSDNLLKKAGGAAAATSLEGKLSTYYKYANIQSMKLEIKEDSTFTMSLKRTSLKGDITKDEEGNFFFNYKVAGRINIGTIQTYLTKSGNTLDITYDVSKLIKLIEKVGSYTGNSTVKGVSSLLNGYDGVTAGFKMKKVETSTTTTK
ncbi:MAG: DUF4923 family protein [Muribaculaceae bacterium]|nr:DUF4923 family protein [Muribaculaceae bacterium]